MQALIVEQPPQAAFQIVVIGTSAGGRNALIQLLSQLSPHFPAPVLIVQHISPDATGNVLLDALNANTPLICERGVSGGVLKPGYVYLAPSDHHLMVDEAGKMLITKGAQENRWRPAIDPLFRSAAVAFGNKVIGIILTGYLDDGAAGMNVIERCGGTCIIQDPADAEYPDMPSNALHQVTSRHCVPIAAMGALLEKLVLRTLGERAAVPEDILIEAKIAERVLSDLPSVNALGKQVPFNCPGCGGVLWKIDEGPTVRFRCHTGHAYSAASLLAEQTKKIEETMWIALRMFEERKNLVTTLMETQQGVALEVSKERVALSQVHIDRIRGILMADDKSTAGDIPK